MCAPTEHVEVAFGMADLFKIVLKGLKGAFGVRCVRRGVGYRAIGLGLELSLGLRSG